MRISRPILSNKMQIEKMNLQCTRKYVFVIIGLLFALHSWSIAYAQEGQTKFIGPGGCTTKAECYAYCEVDSNKEECLTYAVEKGMMTQEEADKARKFLNQTGPGGCRGDECKTYCDDLTHTDECISFAEANGLIKPGEGSHFRKMREISEKGGPGGCRGEQCRQYCEDEANRDECFAFAKENGILSQKQLEGYETGRKIEQAIKKAGGPGGCKSESECHQYCSDKAKIEECVAFGVKYTGKSPEEMRRMLEEFQSGDFRREREGFQSEREEFEQRRQEFEGRIRESGDIRERVMREGFREAPEDRGPESFEGAGESFQGPGGCNSPESCRAYCMSNPQACFSMPRQEGTSDYRSMPPQGYPAPEANYPRPEESQQYEQYDQAPPTSEPTTYPAEYQPQSRGYDRSKPFLANIISAFLLPFRD